MSEPLNTQLDYMDATDPKTDLMFHAKSLMTKLETGSSHEAFLALEELNKARDRSLYYELGRLTRRLHDAISSFHIDMDINTENQKEISRIVDASDRLNYVINLTEQAANKTMDKVEEAVPTANLILETAESLKPEWDKVLKGEIDPKKFRELHNRMGLFIDGTILASKGLNKSLSDILLAQDYQDLTGQVLKRVITMVQEIEQSLVDMVRMAASVEQLAGIKSNDRQVASSIVAEGPVINKEKRNDVVSGQDEVDDLLSSLGF